MINIVHLCDYIDFMPQCRDNQFDLGICDPPYFSGPEKRKYYGNKTGKSFHSKTGVKQHIKRIEYSVSEKWTIPDHKYFNELKRISKNQIIFGINYYDIYLGSGRIIWDKINQGSSFSDCEIAYCSIHDSTRLFRYMWNGMMQGKSVIEGDIQQGNKNKNEKRIHPTQKPVALYKWILQNYATTGQTIFDSHVGSGSSRIACYDLGFDFTGCELDPDYHVAQEERYKRHISQQPLFEPEELRQPEQVDLFKDQL